MLDPDAAAHVRQIDALARTGLTQHAIALALDAAYPRPDGQRWHPAQVGRILANRHLYRGGRQGRSKHWWPVLLAADTRA